MHTKGKEGMHIKKIIYKIAQFIYIAMDLIRAGGMCMAYKRIKD